MNEYINKPCSELCPFIDIETLKFKSDYYLLSFNDTKNLVRYRYNMSVKQYDIFQKYEESLFKQFLELIKVKEDKPIFIFSYESIWNVCELGRYSNIYIKNGVIKTDEIKNIELVFKKALQYKAFPVFYNDSLKIVIIPTDHLDLFIGINDRHALSNLSINKKIFSFVKQEEKQSGDGSKPLKKSD